VDRLSLITINLWCRKDIDSPELAQPLFEHIIYKHGVRDNIVTDRGTQFTSPVWTWVCSHFSTDHRLSTAFHPQTDGQTERQNQMMERYLQASCNYQLDNWVELWPRDDFTSNNAVPTSTRMTVLWENYHCHPVMQFKAPMQPSSLNSEIQTDTFAAGLVETHQTHWNNSQEAQASQTKYTSGKEVVSEVGDKVWLSTQHFWTTRPSKKLDYNRTGLYMVSNVINKIAYILDLPYTIRKHIVFHVSLLDPNKPSTASQPPSELQLRMVDNSEEWEVDQVLDSTRRYWKLHCPVQWASYSFICTSWQPAENLGNSQELIDEFHREHPRKPRWWFDVFYGGCTFLTFFYILGE